MRSDSAQTAVIRVEFARSLTPLWIELPDYKPAGILESTPAHIRQYFSFHVEKSWMKDNDAFYSWFRVYLVSDKAYGGG